MTDSTAVGPPPGEWLDQLLIQLWERRGTDLLLTAGARPLVRVDGDLHPLPEQPVLKPADTAAMAESLLSPGDMEIFKARGDVDFAFGFRQRARVRCNAFVQRNSTSLALRVIPSEIPTMDDLGLPKAVQKMVDSPSGLILVTGPTGSGKTTTLAAMIDHLNRTRHGHILTIEDPIEFVHKHHGGAVNQREVGKDTESFARGLRAALREDPDILMIGEMRDYESVSTALTLAETGHLVLASLHTNDTTQSIDRLVGVFPGDQQNQARLQVAASLIGVVYQRLVPEKVGGMVAAFEVLMGTYAVRTLIRESNTRQIRNAITMGQNEGMQTLEMALSTLVRGGLVDREEAVARSLYPKEIAQPQAVSSGR
jgi:twitching motility protein PilT